MKRFSISTFSTVAMMVGLSSVAFAAEGEAVSASPSLDFYVWTVIAAGICIAFAAGLCGIGQGLGLKSAVEGIARNPESSGKVTVTMLIGLAMIESLCIYALVVSLILIFANPATETVGKVLGITQ
ncbi:MAG: ATP synthase F0 subunit C [Pseudomonadota bacterium]